MDISASQFKAKCLDLMDVVAESGGEYIITKHGKPVAKLVAYAAPQAKQSPFGFLQGTVQVTGDLLAPLHEAWGEDDDPAEMNPSKSKRPKAGAPK